MNAGELTWQAVQLALASSVCQAGRIGRAVSDDVCAVPAVASECRRPRVRTWHRHLRLYSEVLVEQVVLSG